MAGVELGLAPAIAASAMTQVGTGIVMLGIVLSGVVIVASLLMARNARYRLLERRRLAAIRERVRLIQAELLASAGVVPETPRWPGPHVGDR